MQQVSRLWLLCSALLLAGVVASSCASPQAITSPPSQTAAPPAEATHTLYFPLVTSQAPGVPQLPQDASWQIQYTGELDLSLDADVFNLDLFETAPAAIQELHRRGIFVMCYFSAGSYEDWRPDQAQFPAEVLGEELEGWPGERWLDIRRLEALAPIMEERLDLAVQKGCDGADPDNVNGFENETGFPLSAADQLAYNRFLASAAHARRLAIGLKNDLGQIAELEPYFDWILNEECFSYSECALLEPFREAGKPVFVIEYELGPEEFCAQANELGFNALHKNWELDAYRTECRSFTGKP